MVRPSGPSWNHSLEFFGEQNGATVSGLQMGALSPSVEPWLGDPVSMSCYIQRALHVPPLLCRSAALRREHLTAVVRCPGPEMPSRGRCDTGTQDRAYLRRDQVPSAPYKCGINEN